MNSTARLGLQKPQTSDAATGLRTPIGTNADKLDDAAIDLQGTLAGRPTSTPGSPGVRGRYYYATDTKQLFRDSGTGWDEIQVGPVAKADLATDALNAFLKLLAPADRRVAIGSGSFTWAGTTMGIAVAHGLAATPIFAIASLIEGGSVFFNAQYVGYSSPGATSVTFKFQAVNGAAPAPGTSQYAWLAIA